MSSGDQINMQELLEQAQKMQEQLMNAQEQLAEARVEGSAGGGLVKATVSGTGEVVSVTIAPSTIDQEDPAETAETIADLVVAAIRDANESASDLQQQQMGPFAEGMGGGGPELPGS